MKRTKKQFQEEASRLLIRKYVRKTLKEGAGGEPPAEAEEEEPEPEEAQDEPGLEEELAELTDLYVKKLKNAQAAVDQSDMIEIMAQLIDSFGYGNQDKLTVLQGVKEMTIR